MMQEKENGATISQQDADKLLLDSSGLSYPETIKNTPQWKEEAKKRPAVQRKEPTSRIELRASKDPEQIVKVSQIIKQLITEKFPKGKIKEIRVVFQDSGVLQQGEVEDDEADLQ